MRLSSIRYLIGEGFKNTWVNRLMSIASIGVLVACMVIIGLALLIAENVEVAILSNCYHTEQREEKIKWLKEKGYALEEILELIEYIANTKS